MSKMGRPPKEIDKKEFEGLLAIQCTLEEVTAFFDIKLGGCSEDTIQRWCKKEYGETFAVVSAKKRNYGKISLRRSQFRLAEKNATMAIFLGKNYLGQADKIEQTINTIDDTMRKDVDELLNDIRAEINDTAIDDETTDNRE